MKIILALLLLSGCTLNVSGQDKRIERLEAMVDTKADATRVDTILQAVGAQLGELNNRVKKLETEKPK